LQCNGRRSRQILKHFLLQKKSNAGIGTLISNRFSPAGGVDLPGIPRHTPRSLQEKDPENLNDKAHIIECNWDSYRLQEAMKNQKNS